LNTIHQLPADQPVRREGHRFREGIQGKESCLPGIRTCHQVASFSFAPEPYADGLSFRVVKIGMNGKHRSYGYIYTGFFFELSPGRRTDIFLPFHMSAWNTPGAGVRTDASDEEQLIAFKQHHRNPDRGIAMISGFTPITIQMFFSLSCAVSKYGAAGGTVAKGKRAPACMDRRKVVAHEKSVPVVGEYRKRSVSSALPSKFISGLMGFVKTIYQ